jgi:chromosome segregation ATPase
LLLFALDEHGNRLDAGQIESLFRLPGRTDGAVTLDDQTRAVLREGISDARAETIAQLEDRINAWMDQEQMKLDEWSRDRRENLVGEIDKLDREIERLRREGRTRGGNLRENQARRAEIATMVKRRDDLEDRNRIRRREIEREQEELLDRAYARIHHNSIETPLFTLRWSIM